jgi:hypothetical protein
LGLISPAMLRSKLMLRDLYGKEANLGWDSVISKEESLAWVKRFQGQMQEGAAVFPRSCKPKEAVGDPEMVGFADASLQALCVVIYVVWKLRSGDREARILTAKCWVTPLQGTSILRGELQALVVLLRLLVSTVTAIRNKVTRVIVFSDSECTLAALKKSGALMRPYFANRVSESLMLLKELERLCEEVVEVRHVAGHLNPADLGTRGNVKMADMGPGSPWQVGPEFLKLERDQWPVGNGKEETVPEEECLQFHTASLQVENCNEEKNPWKRILAEVRERKSLGEKVIVMALEVLRKEKWASCLRIFALVLRAIVQQDREAIGRASDLSPDEVDLAKRILFAASAQSAREALQKGTLLSLGGRLINQEVWIDPRVSRERLAVLMGVGSLRIIMAKEPLAVILTRAAHEEDHRKNYKDVVARVRRRVWVPGGSRVAKDIVTKCAVCRIRDKKTGGQIMAILPDCKVTSAAPFINTSLDLFGPFKIKDVAKGRRSFKCWGVVFACLSTKATCIMACLGYDAKTFVTTFQAFVAIYGPPLWSTTPTPPASSRPLVTWTGTRCPRSWAGEGLGGS